MNFPGEYIIFHPVHLNILNYGMILYFMTRIEYYMENDNHLPKILSIHSDQLFSPFFLLKALYE